MSECISEVPCGCFGCENEMVKRAYPLDFAPKLIHMIVPVEKIDRCQVVGSYFKKFYHVSIHFGSKNIIILVNSSNVGKKLIW